MTVRFTLLSIEQHEGLTWITREKNRFSVEVVVPVVVAIAPGTNSLLDLN